MITIFYIGKKLHTESRGLMGMYYSTIGARYDVGDIIDMIDRGAEIYVRPATDDELARCRVILERLKLTSLYKDEGLHHELQKTA